MENGRQSDPWQLLRQHRGHSWEMRPTGHTELRGQKCVLLNASRYIPKCFFLSHVKWPIFTIVNYDIR